MSQTFGGAGTKREAHRGGLGEKKRGGRKLDTGATAEGGSGSIREPEGWRKISSRLKGQRLSDQMEDASLEEVCVFDL